ncbi:glycosyltransferase family 69 protein [Sporormia fimetaria CBS 119925]|uniref:Glycosyltransferase family 69 protein n=1 Tax=Sporormia fimetaria CBS 119925 TaxID=1340428 RepID=A0A6A6UZM1_9PLEO|nr:glycosyltransferase family 69 protein [Sporormia fimetaria CBS 119925]
MPATFRRAGQHSYEPLPRASFESDDLPDLERSASNASWMSRFAESLPLKRMSSASTYTHYITPRRRKRSLLRAVYWCLCVSPYICITLVLLVSLFFPSYTKPPPHYRELYQASVRSSEPGRANPHNEKIFIVASLYEKAGELTSGAWGDAVLSLVDLLGPDNVYLSVYEDNPSEATLNSLNTFKSRVNCNSSIIGEELDLKTLPRVPLPNGTTRLKRIAFLAEVRNRALAPLETSPVRFDRLLYINDVVFNPIEAAQLVLNTNTDPTTGRASYSAACAVDFINPFKFYDRYATRDMDGYTTGIPFFPWFTSAGSAISRTAVLANSDAVPVRSCWGGMTAFDAKWFQHRQYPNNTDIESTIDNTTLAPLRFRYEKATFWDSSECCLIHADLAYLSSGTGMPANSNIYMNPYIRVAYDSSTLSWLSLSRRPEYLYSVIHDWLNKWIGFPGTNERMNEEPGETYTDTMWAYDDPERAFAPNASGTEVFKGHWEKKEHVALPGGFCGGRQLLVINEDRTQGEGKWGKILAPSPPERR